MKKVIIGILLSAVLLGLAACGGPEPSNADQVITRGTVKNTEAAVPQAQNGTEANAGFAAFQAEGVALIPGEAFQADALSEPASVYQAPSCAIEGTDNVYDYGTFELTAFDDGSGETIYSIYFKDPAAATPEGLSLGDGVEKVTELYGTDYQAEGTAYQYTSGKTLLSIIIQNDTVVSIEYRLITE